MTATGAGGMGRPAGRPPRQAVIMTGLLIALALSGLIYQAGVALERTLFNAAFYRALSAELELPARGQAYLLESLFREENGLVLPESLLKRAVTAAVSREWLQEQSDAMIGEFVAFIRGERERLLLAVDLRQPEAVLKRELIRSLSRQHLEQLALTEAFVEDFMEELDLPDYLILVDAASPESLGAEAAQALRLIRRARAFGSAAPLFAVALAALACIIGAGAAGGLKWSGGGLLAAGSLGYLLLPPAAGRLAAAEAARIAAACERLGAFSGANPAVGGVAAAFTRSGLAASALVFAGAGLILLAAGFVIGAAGKAGARRAPAAKRK